MTVRPSPSWWRPLLADGTRGFVMLPANTDVDAAQAASTGSDWREVSPVEYYEALIEAEWARPEPDEAWIESLEETRDLWARESSEGH